MVKVMTNERAEEAVKSALNLNMPAVKYPPTDIYPNVVSHCLRLWQTECDECISNMK